MSQSTDNLLLLPGLLNDSSVWDEQVARLEEVATLHVPDYGAEDDLGDLACRVLEQAPPRFLMAGFSMGGYLALEIMRRAPERVQALALVATSARPDSDEQLAMREKVITAVKRGKFDKVVAVTTDSALYSGAHELSRQRCKMSAMANAVGPERFCAHLRAVMGRPDSRPMLSSIDLPVAVIVGEEDRVVPPEHSRELAALIPGAKLTLVPACGHMLPLQGAGALSSRLLDLLAKSKEYDEG
jgi:pimeloyl-ACP methyl ester carboxylesterase